MQIATLQWAVAMFCALIGAMMMIVPHQFETPAYAILQPHLAGWGCLYLLAGAALCAVVISTAPRWAVIGAHGAAGAALLLWAVGFSFASAWNGAASLGVLGLGTLAAAALPRAALHGARAYRPGADRHLLPLVMGVASLAAGLMLVVLPGQSFSAPAYAAAKPRLVWFGLAFIAGGLLLCAVQARPAARGRAVAAVHLLAGAPFLAFFVVLGVWAHRMAVMVYYGWFGAFIAAFPWLSRVLTPVRLESLRTRLSLVLVAAVALPLLLTVAVLSERSERAAVRQELTLQQALTRSVAGDITDYVSIHGAAAGALTVSPGLSSALAARLERISRELRGGNAYVVDGRGRLIAQGVRSAAAPLADFAGVPPVEAFLARRDASGTLRFRGRNGDMLAAYARIPGTDWGVVVEQPASVALGVTRAGRETAFALLLVAVGIAVAGGVTAAGGVIRPLRALAREADRVGESNTPLALPRTGVAEVTHLADRFAELHARLAVRTEEWERAHAALRASEERTRRILESASDAFIEMDAVGVIIAWNAQAEQIFGWRRDEAVGRVLRDLIVPPALRDAHERGLRRYLATGESTLLNRHVELTAFHRDGHEFPIELTMSVVREGATQSFSAFVRDITARRQSQEALNQRAQELARSNAELQAFAYVASHDLQEPLRMVTSYVQLLARRYGNRLDVEAREFIGYALDGATRMHELIDDLLAYSRVGTRGEELRPTESEGALANAVANLKVAIEESGAGVTHDPLPAVLGDESQLAQLFQNLIGNAIKFRGSDPLRVHISARRADREWEFSVADNGIGIAPEHRERVFVIFQRLHSRAEYPGTGIGLAICKKIVERHGGRIWVTPTPGGGATFHFRLPAAEMLAHA